MSALIVIPTRIETTKHFDHTFKALTTIRSTEPDAEILLVDDGSTDLELLSIIKRHGLDVEVHSRAKSRGFASAVNIGLKRARKAGQDAVVCNADVWFPEEGWLGRFRERKAGIVGGLLLHHNNLVQQAGFYYSLRHRRFAPRFIFSPGNLAEVNKPVICPVPSTLMYISAETLSDVGLFDPKFLFGWEDVDYCMRAHELGHESWYDHRVRAYHGGGGFHEPFAEKGRVINWRIKSRLYLARKWGDKAVPEFIPTALNV